jgi:hypothetical protein
MDLTKLNAYVQLIQDIMAGTVRRHTFTPLELQLLLDVQAARIRKSAKNDILRRYSRTVQHQFALNHSVPIRFARFWEDQNKGGLQTPEPSRPILQARGAGRS